MCECGSLAQKPLFVYIKVEQMTCAWILTQQQVCLLFEELSSITMHCFEPLIKNKNDSRKWKCKNCWRFTIQYHEKLREQWNVSFSHFSFFRVLFPVIGSPSIAMQRRHREYNYFLVLSTRKSTCVKTLFRKQTVDFIFFSQKAERKRYRERERKFLIS